MLPFMINNGIKEIMDKVSNDTGQLTSVTLVYYRDRLLCEIDRFYKAEQMTGSEPMQQLDIRRRINDIGHIIDDIDNKLANISTNNSSKSIGLQFSKLSAKLKASK